MPAASFRSSVVIVLTLLFVRGFILPADGADKLEPTIKEITRQPNLPEGKAVDFHLKYHDSSELNKGYRNEKGIFTNYSVRHVLVISCFRRGGRSAIRYTITDACEFDRVFSTYDYAEQGGDTRVVTKPELTQLKELLSKLPTSQSDPPISHALTISFMDATNWRTLIYDERELPATLEQILKVLRVEGDIKRDSLR